MQFCQALPRVFATGSLDGSVKIWEVTSNGPSLVCTRDMKKELDQIMCMKFDPTSPFVLAIGGTKGRGELIFKPFCLFVCMIRDKLSGSVLFLVLCRIRDLGHHGESRNGTSIRQI